MKVNITELLLFFDELMPTTDEEQGIYWFKTLRPDGLVITFAFSIHEKYVDIIVHNTFKVDIIGLSLVDCSEIRILDENKKCLEVLHENKSGRCFLSLFSGPILEYNE